MIGLTIAMAAAIFTWHDEGGALELREKGQPVLSYAHGKRLENGAPEVKRRSGYVNKVWAPNGALVTDDFPKDHWHHRGLFWGWPRVVHEGKTHDGWLLRGTIDSRHVKWLEKKDGDTAQLGAENAWFVADKEIVREQIRMTVTPSKGGARRMAFTLRLEAVGSPVELIGAPEENKGYGGFSVRFAPRTDTVIRTDKGIEAKDTDMVPHPWAELEANYGGKKARLQIDQSPENPGYPAGWCLRKYGFLGVNYPGLTPVRLEPGKPLTLKYEVTVSGE